jgi:hypothetical protein
VSLGSSRLPFTEDSMIFLSSTSLLAGTWGVATAFGILNHQEWARISVITFSWLCLVYCVLPMLYFPLVPLAPIEGASVDFISHWRLGATAYFAVFVGVGSWWLYFFNKASVKERFSRNIELTYGQSSDQAHLSRPLGISVVAWYLFITAFLFTATFSYRVPVFLFGFGLTGWEASLIKVIFALVHILTMVGLLELKRWSRTLAICYFSFLILDTIASVWIRGQRSVFEKLLTMAPASIGRSEFPAARSLIVALGLAIPLFALPLWVVVTEKHALVKTA